MWCVYGDFHLLLIRHANPIPLPFFGAVHIDVNNVSTTCDHQSFVLLHWRVISSTTSLDRLMAVAPITLSPPPFNFLTMETSLPITHLLLFRTPIPNPSQRIIDLPVDHSSTARRRSEVLLPTLANLSQLIYVNSSPNPLGQPIPFSYL